MPEVHAGFTNSLTTIKEMKIKVCGMRHPDNIRELVKLKPDYMGFIFYEVSPRYAGNMLTRSTLSLIPEQIKKTGVFVNSTPEAITHTIQRFGLDAVQLHGVETPAFCAAVKNTGVEVIKAFALKSKSDLIPANKYKACCDFLLFDTPTLDYGGSGRKFNWDLLKEQEISLPFFLSGGLEESDAETILNECPVPPYGVDLNSRFETEPGLKNIKAIERFMKRIRIAGKDGLKNKAFNNPTT